MTLGSEMTEPFLTQGLATTTGTREPSREYGSKVLQFAVPSSLQKHAGWSSGGGADIGGSTWSKKPPASSHVIKKTVWFQPGPERSAS